MYRIQLIVAFIVLLLASCAPVPVTQGPAITDTPASVSPEPPTSTAAPPTSTAEAATDTPVVATPTVAPPPGVQGQQRTEVCSGQLLVTDIAGGVIGGTGQYTM